MSCDYSLIGVLDSINNSRNGQRSTQKVMSFVARCVLRLERAMEPIQKTIEFLIKNKWLGILLILGLAGGVGISTFYRGAISPKQRTDLTVFLKAGEVVAEGRADQIYESQNARHWRYVYPPTLAILLAPVSKWPLGITVTLAYLLSLACLAGTVTLSRRSFKTAGPAPWQIVLAMFFCLPILLNTLSRGQFGIITLFFMAAIFYSYMEERKILTGILFAFAVALKISPLAFLVFFFLMRREWKILVSAALGAFLFFFLIPSMIIGFHQNWELLMIWRGLMSISQSDGAHHNYLWAQLFTPFAEDNISIYAVVTRLAWPSEAQFIGHSNAFVRLVTSGTGILLLTLPFIQTKNTPSSLAKNPLRALAEFSLFPALMLFTSPVTQIHHYTVFFFLFLVTLMMIKRLPRGYWTRTYLQISLWTCAISLLLGMVVPLMGYWGIPLWGSMLLWTAILCGLPQDSTQNSVHGT